MASIIPFLEIAGRSVAVYLFMILAIKFFRKENGERGKICLGLINH